MGSSDSTAKPASKGGKQSAGDLQQKVTYLPDVHRLLPQSPDAERALLGSILLLPKEVFGLCVEKGVSAAQFHVPAHATLYELIEQMWNQNVPVDLVTVTQKLLDQNRLDQVGGAAFVAELFTFVPTAANAAYYIEIVQEKHTLRRIIVTCTEYAARSYDEQEEVHGLLDQVEQKIFEIAKERFKDKVKSIKEHVMEAVESIEQLYERRGGITGLSTGFKDLDERVDGLHAGEMFVIAARPSMGKTALAMNIAEHVAVDLKKPVAVFSLEMSTSQLVQRLICSRAQVNMKKIKEGFLTDIHFKNLTTAASKFSEAKLFIDDTPNLSILELRAKARRMKSQDKIELIVIDYLQLIRSTSRRAQDNRQLEIAEISSGIKALAKELQIPILILAQLNRNPENRTGESKGRPRLSDLRESGTIEQDADVVGLLVREEYYAETDEEKTEAQGKATLIIAKQRNGPTGEVALTFLKDFTRFEDRAVAAGEEP